MEIAQLGYFWEGLLRNPRKALSKQKTTKNIGDSIRIVFASWFVVSLLVMVVVLLLGLDNYINSPIAPLLKSTFGFIFIFLFLGLFAFANSFLMCVAFLISSYFYYAISKFLRGKGTFNCHTYLLALVFSFLPLINFLKLFPYVGDYLYGLGALYVLYLYGIALDEVHGYGFVWGMLIAFSPIVALLLILFPFFLI